MVAGLPEVVDLAEIEEKRTPVVLSGFWPPQNLGSREGNGSRWPPEGFAVAEPQPLHARAARSSEALPAVR